MSPDKCPQAVLKKLADPSQCVDKVLVMNTLRIETDPARIANIIDKYPGMVIGVYDRVATEDMIKEDIEA